MTAPGAAQSTAVAIGAGAAGLATASQLQRRGVDVLVLDRDGPGASWRHRYDGLRLDTLRSMSALPGHRPSRRLGRWPSQLAAAWATGKVVCSTSKSSTSSRSRRLRARA
jgi:cation diffusion facilitator CzcD-associated flavoprotein CzcO